MNKNLSPSIAIILLTCISFFGCRKEIYETPCRLQYIQGLDDQYLRTLHYNQYGMLDKWTEHQPEFDYEISFTVEYDKAKRVSQLKYYNHGQFSFFIIPEYQNGRVAREKYYFSDHTLGDIIEVTYNGKGQIIKKASIANYYHIVFQYDQYGNMTNDKVIDELSNSILLNEKFKYNKPVREPMTTVVGLPYPIPFSNYIISPLIWSDFSAEGYDNFGQFGLIYDYDPSKSDLTSGKDHFAVYRDAYDKISGQHTRKAWKYENCNCGGVVKQSASAYKTFKTKAKSSGPQLLTILQIKALVKSNRKK